MWKYLDPKDSKGAPLKGKDAVAQARELFSIKDPGCPVLELESGLVAAWCAAPLKKATDYPLLHAKPIGESPFDYEKG